MPNLAAAIKEEVTRLARKEVKSQVAATRKATAQHRREIAEMKRQLKSLQRDVAFLQSQERARVAKRPSAEAAEGARFSASGLKSHRARLGVSAADYATLVGVHQITIYNWEQGKTRPRPEQLASLVAIRKLGKREALKRLELME